MRLQFNVSGNFTNDRNGDVLNLFIFSKVVTTFVKNGFESGRSPINYDCEGNGLEIIRHATKTDRRDVVYDNRL